jgi:hypothetical protein
MRIGRFTVGETMIVGFGSLLFVDSFLPWFRLCVEFLGTGSCASASGWSNALSLLAVLVAVAMVAQVIAGRYAPGALSSLGTLRWGTIHLVAGAVSFGLIALQVAVGDDGIPRAYGAYAGLVLGAGLAAGGLLRSRERDVAEVPR